MDKGNLQRTEFITSLQFSNHPIRGVKQDIKASYYQAMKTLVNKYTPNPEFARARMEQYWASWFAGTSTNSLNEQEEQKNLRLMLNDRLRPWRRKYRFMLLIDVALVLCDEHAIKQAIHDAGSYLSARQKAQLDEVTGLLFNNKGIPAKFSYLEPILQQFRSNTAYAKLPELRIILTANMSAGKSTLVNAMIGKPVARTSQEACTAHLNYLYNKSFEDDCIHIKNTVLNLNASYEYLIQAESESGQQVAAYFQTTIPMQQRVCLIDTPGVNSAMNPEHSKLTRHALMNEHYDKLIYVLNATQLGTDEDMRHLKFVANNVPKEKTIFVMNKLDHFKAKDDSIAESMMKVRKDLEELGYDNPIICPISAYFSLLLKLRQQGDQLTEDELDDYERFIKKFSREEFNLSNYYSKSTLEAEKINEDLFLQNLHRSGMLNLEKLLYGGVVK